MASTDGRRPAQRHASREKREIGAQRPGLLFWTGVGVYGGFVALLLFDAFFGLPAIGWKGPGDHGSAHAQMRIFVLGIENTVETKGRLPTSLAEFMNGVPPDPWGNEYRYLRLGPKTFRLRSAGEDGIYETDDDIVLPDEGD